MSISIYLSLSLSLYRGCAHGYLYATHKSRNGDPNVMFK